MSRLYSDDVTEKDAANMADLDDAWGIIVNLYEDIKCLKEDLVEANDGRREE